jgi:hypothetical protein
MWDFNWGIFRGSFGARGVQVWSHRSSDFMVLGFSSRAKSLFAATSLVNNYEVATEVLTAVSEPSLALRPNQEMTLMPCTPDFFAHSQCGFQMAVQRSLGGACSIQSVTVACPITR